MQMYPNPKDYHCPACGETPGFITHDLRSLCGPGCGWQTMSENTESEYDPTDDLYDAFAVGDIDMDGRAR